MGRNEAAGSCTCACNPRNEACIQDFCFFLSRSLLQLDMTHSTAEPPELRLSSRLRHWDNNNPHMYSDIPVRFPQPSVAPIGCLSLQCRSLGICPRHKRVAKLLTYHGTYTYAIVVSKKEQKSPPSASAREEQDSQELPIEGYPLFFLSGNMCKSSRSAMYVYTSTAKSIT